jgi:low temperature requirement protein LtrA
MRDSVEDKNMKIIRGPTIHDEAHDETFFELFYDLILVVVFIKVRSNNTNV